MCHGPTGQGDGQAAASLNPKPRNYRREVAGERHRRQIRQTSSQGGQAMGKSPMMPGQPQLKNEPEVLDELVKIIRGFGKK